MKLEHGSKLTEIGPIPEDWETKRLKEMAPIATGNTPPTNDAANYGDEFLFVGPVDMGDSKFITTTEKMLSKKGFAKSRQFPEGAILFVCIGSTIGKCGIAATKLTSNQQINAIFPSTNFSNEFLFYAVSFAAPRIKAQAGEQAVPLVNKTQFSETLIAVPPLREQRAIAQVLSDVDALIATLDRLIAKKRDIKKATMQQLLTGKTRLPGFSGKWEAKKLGDLGSTYGGLTGKKKTDFGVGPGLYVTFMNVMKNVVIDCGTFEKVQVTSEENQNLVKKGDLLFNGSSETPEEVAMCSFMSACIPNLFLNSFCFGFSVRDKQQVDGLFLAYYIRANPGRELMKSLAQGSTRYNLSKPALLEALIQIPEKPEQSAIAAVLSDMDAELSALEARRDKTRLLKHGMMQELLTGRTRLI